MLASIAALVIAATIVMAVIFFVVLPQQQAAASPVSGSTRSSDRAALQRPSNSDNWLAWVNYYRVAGGSTPVTEDGSLTSGIVKHLNYLTNTPMSLRQGQWGIDHTENPQAPLFTTDGDRAGKL